MDLDSLKLEDRTGLPEPLRILLEEYPREGWAAHQNFQGMVQFWLDRHMMFRKILSMLDADVQKFLDRNVDPQGYAAHLSRLGGRFVNELHGHHTIEDMHYFPVLAKQAPVIEKGFELLDHDHHAIDGFLSAFVEGANGVLQNMSDRNVMQDKAGAFQAELARLNGLLDRHLTDEEELVVPVILKYGADALPH